MRYVARNIVVSALLSALPASAAPVDFARDIRPILQQHCYKCHGPDQQKSSFRLDIKAAAIGGGEFYGPAIVPGDSSGSPLIQLVQDSDDTARMPANSEKLSPDKIAILVRWIDEGANWPDGVDTATLEDRLDHWSFKPITNPSPPPTADPAWPKNPIDSFILSRLEHEELSPSPVAERGSWLRRVYYDLVGLPPTPDELTEFLKDPSDDPYERVVDRLLDSPRYGERWAQHWLDLVRYADTHGFEVNTERPNAWPYRDYVIRALNKDLPYDQFIKQQLVGDALGEDAATGFLVTASVLLPGQTGKDDASKRLARQDAIDEIVVNVGQTFLGLSVGCARCHDHKFDPISQRDYYAMQAFVAGVEYDNRDLHTPDAEATREKVETLKRERLQMDEQLVQVAPLAQPHSANRETTKSSNQVNPSVAAKPTLRPAVNARLNADRFAPITAKQVRFTIRDTNRLEPRIDELQVLDISGNNVARTDCTAISNPTSKAALPVGHDAGRVIDGRFGDDSTWQSNERNSGQLVLTFASVHTIDRVVWGRDRGGQSNDRIPTSYQIEIADEAGDWRLVANSSDRVRFVPNDELFVYSTEGLNEDEAQRMLRLLNEESSIEGELTQCQDSLFVFAGKFREPDKIHLLTRGNPEQPKDEVAPAVLHAVGDIALPIDSPEQNRRIALANWIASPTNPLTARVIANRVWQGHFGVGIVDTPSDFGRNGAKPTHPELLDWLAHELIRSGWSLKHLHKLIVLSAAYRQSTEYNALGTVKDIDDRLLWRYPPRRIDAEAIRDSILYLNGRLNSVMYGRGFDLFNRRGGLEGFLPIESFSGDGLRRMIYAHKVRRERDPVFGAFDCPDGGQSSARRRESITPLQALNLLNSRFTLEQADAFAKRIENDVGDEPARQVERAFTLAFSRPATPDEIDWAHSYVSSYGLKVLCRALINSNEFVYLH